MTLPVLDMSAWSILDYELAFDGIRQISDASLWLQNQPRAYSERGATYHPGAGFILAVGEDWCGDILTAIIDELERRRFSDPDDEDRRLRLLLTYHAGFGPAGTSVPDLMAMLDQWKAPLAA